MNIISDLQKDYPPLKSEDITPRTAKAIALFQEIAQEAHVQNWEVFFLSGFAVDAHFGYLTRQHKDVDLMVSSETIPHIKSFLESKGYAPYEPEFVKGECLKVDQAEPDKPMRSHADIHYFWEDSEGRVTMLAQGKEMKLSAGAREATEELIFLGETTRFLKPKFLLEEKYGWHKQAGLTVWPENLSEIEKIEYLLKLSNFNS
jgi:hypothetical protein